MVYIHGARVANFDDNDLTPTLSFEFDVFNGSLATVEFEEEIGGYVALDGARFTGITLDKKGSYTMA
jgi:hypothetical protein